MIVLDASAMVELLLETECGSRVADRLIGESLNVPAHFDIEVVGAIRRSVQRDVLSDRDGLIAIADLALLRRRTWPVSVLIERAYELRHNCSVADAMYVALAEGLETILLTCDRRLAAATGNGAAVEAIV